jgi:anti-sigma regulatory factor (Ser/Thr protein kinase)/RimJ/RimL family protein N-acetyltransferase
MVIPIYGVLSNRYNLLHLEDRMRTKDALKLTIPNDISYLPIAQLYVREAARKFGFEGSALIKIELAVEEAVSNVIKHAFDSSETSTFDIICERIPPGIRIRIKEKGLPFDPAILPQYDPSKLMEEWAARGLGMHLMKESMDEVTFHNLGLEGKETHLIKYLPGKHAGEQDSEPTDAQKPTEPEVIQEKIDYDVRGLESAEAIEVSRCAYKSHGYTFFDEHIYYPDRLVELNRTGQMISSVAVTKDKKFMGHAALVYPFPESRIAELTFVFVNVEYRGQGCMSRLCDYLFNQVQHGLSGIYAYAVTNHVFTQKVMLKYGFNDCGILLATSPASWEFKGMEENTQRVSVVLSFKYLKAPPALTLYAPPHHLDIISKLYASIQGCPQFAETPAADLSAAPKESVIKMELFSAENCAELQIEQYGQHVVKELKHILHELCVKQIAAINLFLSLENPATAVMAAEFEKLGFFFAGILPQAACGDSLILQYLNNVAFDYTKVQAYSPIAKELLAYIKAHDPNEEQ